MQRTIFECPKSILSAGLVALGTLSLYENLAAAFSELSHVLAANGSQAIGVLSATALAVSSNQHHLTQSLMPSISASGWPLVSLVAGMFLSKSGLAAHCGQTPSLDRPSGR